MGDYRSGRGRGGFDRGRGGRGGGGPKFQKSGPDDPRVNSTVQIFVEGLPVTCKVPEVLKYFSTVGQIKTDRLTKKPRIWLYHDKATNQPTGEATITYRDTQSQLSALQTFDGQYYEGNQIRVTPSIVKAHMAKPPPPQSGGRGGRGGFDRGRGGRGGFDRGRGGRGGFDRGNRGNRDRGGFGGRGGGFRGRDEGFRSRDEGFRGRGGGFRGRQGGDNANYEQIGPMRRGGFGGQNRGYGDQGGFGNRYQPY